ncbi:MAG: hypothetical protein A3B38_02725 [Candidatus Levybacteria bacterium RIFCSPLOWO2_01_FULL_36_13]|nr:MAG: hypothetical protein A2684_03920 [Candidatus Levybacteria bacterium RIFCSPHIGHO2_01_FULL_36_15b]OGH35192.1 MAG: hypothetical protein A3B38_02725 [Candidatus Levybacteria bacterium RIFCSPLOWO2_01_FULL_36_13]
MAETEYSMESHKTFERPLNPREAAAKFANCLEEVRLNSVSGSVDNFKIEKLRAILEYAPITDDFKMQIVNRVSRSIETKLLNSVEADYFLDDLEIDVEKEMFGIFDQNEAREIERRTINTEKNNPHLAPKLAQEDEAKIKHWAKAFQAFYNENPFVQH